MFITDILIFYYSYLKMIFLDDIDGNRASMYAWLADCFVSFFVSLFFLGEKYKCLMFKFSSFLLQETSVLAKTLPGRFEIEKKTAKCLCNKLTVGFLSLEEKIMKRTSFRKVMSLLFSVNFFSEERSYHIIFLLFPFIYFCFYSSNLLFLPRYE